MPGDAQLSRHLQGFSVHADAGTPCTSEWIRGAVAVHRARVLFTTKLVQPTRLLGRAIGIRPGPRNASMRFGVHRKSIGMQRTQDTAPGNYSFSIGDTIYANHDGTSSSNRRRGLYVGRRVRRMADIRDGTSNSIALAEKSTGAAKRPFDSWECGGCCRDGQSGESRRVSGDDGHARRV